MVVVQLTFITAVAPYHAHLIPAIRAQVSHQTIPCAHIVIEDHERKGPGAARNAGLAQVKTPFVAFLDADDRIKPTWAEETLAAFEKHGGQRYIYTDHVQDDQVVPAPGCAWVDGTWHVVTALLPTEWAREAGGFDPRLPAFEDTDFYTRLILAGHCGARLARPLFQYGAGGERSARYNNTPTHQAALRYFSRNYGGGRKQMGSCCGDPQPGDLVAIGEHLEGDIMAEATWAGNRSQRGRMTGRIYRTGNWKRTWVDPADVAAQPELWNAVREAETVPDFDFTSFEDYIQQTGDNGSPITSVEQLAAFYMQATTPAEPAAPPPVAIEHEPTPAAKPSASAIKAKASAGRARGKRQSAGAVASKASA